MSERLEGDRGSHDGSGAGDHNQEYKFGNAQTLLHWHEQMTLKFKVNAKEVEERRDQEHTIRPEIQRALDKAQAEFERRKEE